MLLFAEILFLVLSLLTHECSWFCRGEQNNGVAPEIKSGDEELESDKGFGYGQETPPSQDMKDSPQRVERETFGCVEYLAPLVVSAFF